MDVVFLEQSILLGLMGWAATVLAIQGATRLTTTDRRAMIVCFWTVWMIPAFGPLVLNGIIATDTAAFFVGLTTVAIALVMFFGARTRPRIRP